MNKIIILGFMIDPTRMLFELNENYEWTFFHETQLKKFCKKTFKIRIIEFFI